MCEGSEAIFTKWETAASRSSQYNVDALFCVVWSSHGVFSPAALQSNRHLLHSADLLTVRPPPSQSRR